MLSYRPDLTTSPTFTQNFNTYPNTTQFIRFSFFVTLLVGLSPAAPTVTPAHTIEARDTQAANVALIHDLVATTGWEESSQNNITEQNVAKLSPENAQVLAVELNEFSNNHGRPDLVIPQFEDREWRSEAAKVGAAAAMKDAMVDAEAGELVKAREAEWCGEILSSIVDAIVFWFASM